MVSESPGQDLTSVQKFNVVLGELRSIISTVASFEQPNHSRALELRETFMKKCNDDRVTSFAGSDSLAISFLQDNFDKALRALNEKFGKDESGKDIFPIKDLLIKPPPEFSNIPYLEQKEKNTQEGIKTLEQVKNIYGASLGQLNNYTADSVGSLNLTKIQTSYDAITALLDKAREHFEASHGEGSGPEVLTTLLPWRSQINSSLLCGSDAIIAATTPNKKMDEINNLFYKFSQILSIAINNITDGKFDEFEKGRIHKKMDFASWTGRIDTFITSLIKLKEGKSDEDKKQIDHWRDELSLMRKSNHLPPSKLTLQ